MPRADFKFFYPLHVRYGEVDVQGVVYNGHYLTYFDLALTEYMRALGFPPSLENARSGHDPQVVKATVEWRGPVRFDEHVDIGVRVVRIGRSSLTFALEIHGAGKEDLRAFGEVVWVNVDLAKGKSAPLPEAMAAAIRAWEGAALD